MGYCTERRATGKKKPKKKSPRWSQKKKKRQVSRRIWVLLISNAGLRYGHPQQKPKI